jgi:hypothetical protein
MKSQIFLNFTYTWLPIIALIIFFSIFCLSVVYVSRTKTKKLYSKLELIALDDGEINERK